MHRKYLVHSGAIALMSIFSLVTGAFGANSWDGTYQMQGEPQTDGNRNCNADAGQITMSVSGGVARLTFPKGRSIEGKLDDRGYFHTSGGSGNAGEVNGIFKADGTADISSGCVVRHFKKIS
jgi:hypothetical protein